jgi:heptosyltransferase-2
MRRREKVLLFHTAFPGDIILALPLLQVLRAHAEDCIVSVVATPAAAGVLENHPAIDEVILYDKRGRNRGLAGMMTMSRRLRNEKFGVALVPHRSLRSAFITSRAGIPRRIGFSTSAGKWLLTDRVPYRARDHEIRRNLELLRPLGLDPPDFEYPRVYPDDADRARVDELLQSRSPVSQAFDPRKMAAIAPGSVWMTKRWPQESYEELGRLLVEDGFSLALIGGREDRVLCQSIAEGISREHAVVAAGELSLLQSAELIRRCCVAVSNDSAPMHLAVAVQTPVVALFGPTVPEFGFAPRGERDVVLGVPDLSCRPCSIHGGDRCPIGSFDCMVGLTAEMVRTHIKNTLNGTQNPDQR